MTFITVLEHQNHGFGILLVVVLMLVLVVGYVMGVSQSRLETVQMSEE